jgi:hypothetical protein
MFLLPRQAEARHFPEGVEVEYMLEDGQDLGKL